MQATSVPRFVNTCLHACRSACLSMRTSTPAYTQNAYCPTCKDVQKSLRRNQTCYDP